MSGERISANANVSAVHPMIVPFGEMLGFPSSETVATYHNFCEFKKSLISSVIINNILKLNVFSFHTIA